MQRFFFNVYDGVSSPDESGTELTDWQEAHLEAIRLAGAIFMDEAENVSLGEEWRLEVTNESGLILFRFDFLSQRSAALSSQHCALSKPSKDVVISMVD